MKRYNILKIYILKTFTARVNKLLSLINYFHDKKKTMNLIFYNFQYLPKYSDTVTN